MCPPSRCFRSQLLGSSLSVSDTWKMALSRKSFVKAENRGRQGRGGRKRKKIHMIKGRVTRTLDNKLLPSVAKRQSRGKQVPLLGKENIHGALCPHRTSQFLCPEQSWTLAMLH